MESKNEFLQNSPRLSIRKTAQSGRTGLSERELRRRVSEGTVPGFVVGKRKFLVDVVALNQLLEAEAKTQRLR